MASLHPDSIVGCYKLIRLLGEGGMGEVWQALDMPADRLVALKFIRPELLNNSQVRTRFANEARTLGRLEQDRIVPLYAVVEEGDMLAFALRFIDGQSLADRIDALGPQPEKFALTFSRDILNALGYAHEHGVIHRDIKPQNILVTRQDQCFLTDFGIAVAGFIERATIGPSAVGTPHYMSPEQIMRPRDITIANGGQRSDIYSFGVVLFEVLTGQVPFGQDTSPEEIFTVQRAHCQEMPPSPRSINSAVSPALDDIVLWCMEKDPARRPQSCAELLAEIETAVSQPAAQSNFKRRAGVATVIESFPGTETVATPAPQPLPSAPRRGKRNLIVAGSALAAISIAIAGFVMSRPVHKQPDSSQTTPVVTQPVPANPPPGNGKAADPSSGTTSQRPHLPPDTGAQKSNLRSDSSVAKESPQAAPGAALASQAESEFSDGHYCTALSTLDKAIAANPAYRSRRPSYTHGCDIERTQ